MMEQSLKQAAGHTFRLEKWYLDFTGMDGEAMIFYSARMHWHGLSLSFTSWLNHTPDAGIQLKSRFSRVQTPIRTNSTITWYDKPCGVSGTWKALAPEVNARLFDSASGFLDWKCYQPASSVELTIKNTRLSGTGYAEELILTALPWKIPMDELRWGRFLSMPDYMVWIEIRHKNKNKWLWVNGEKMNDCSIEDDRIFVSGTAQMLSLDRHITLESEKKIFSIVQKIGRVMPGFRKAVPLQFLLADEHKWLSHGRLTHPGRPDTEGTAIHELVRFLP